MQITAEMSQEDYGWFAFNQTLEALKSLAAGDAEVIQTADGEPIGVRWVPEGADCAEEISWVAE